MLANCVSNLLLPQPDFAIAQDLYNEIDELETRIGIITTAVRVVGVYDETNDGVKRMLEEGFENDLIPLKNWGAFAEKGGMDGAVDWMPLQDIVQALEKLVQQRSDAMVLLQEVTGMQDILLGTGPGFSDFAVHIAFGPGFSLLRLTLSEISFHCKICLLQ